MLLPRSLLSRAYSTPSFLKKPPLARPYLWWLRARYRTDGTRRSILRGILHGACYACVTVYAYRQYHLIKSRDRLIRKLSDIIELQRINHKYRASTFTEPAEIKAYIADIAKVEFIPGVPETFSLFCEEYDALSENVPENREKVRERIRELSEALAMNPNFAKRIHSSKDSLFLDIALEVRNAYEKLALEVGETLLAHTKKQKEKLQEVFNRLTTQ